MPQKRAPLEALQGCSTERQMRASLEALQGCTPGLEKKAPLKALQVCTREESTPGSPPGVQPRKPSRGAPLVQRREHPWMPSRCAPENRAPLEALQGCTPGKPQGLYRWATDTIWKKCAQRRQHQYLYKQRVKVLPLGMVDDLIAVSICGHQSAELNICITTHIEMKKIEVPYARQ